MAILRNPYFLWSYWAVGFIASFFSPALSASLLGGFIFLVSTYSQ